VKGGLIEEEGGEGKEEEEEEYWSVLTMDGHGMVVGHV